MRLKLQRSQRVGGVIASSVIFCLSARAEYTPEERHNIGRYRLGGQVIYNSRAAQRHLEHAGAHLDRTQEGTVGRRAAGLARGVASMALAKMQLNISIGSLGKGHHVECKDLEELLESEDTIRTACKNLTRYLDAASTFDGSEVVIEYVNGEEKVHTALNAPPLLEYQGESAGADEPIDATFEPVPANPVLDAMGKDFARFGRMIRDRWVVLEGKIVRRLADAGYTVDPLVVRGACGVLGLIAFIVLIEVL
jgi:hypothetical protein